MPDLTDEDIEALILKTSIDPKAKEEFNKIIAEQVKDIPTFVPDVIPDAIGDDSAFIATVAKEIRFEPRKQLLDWTSSDKDEAPDPIIPTKSFVYTLFSELLARYGEQTVIDRLLAFK